MTDLKPLYDYVLSQKDKYVKRLQEYVAVQSVSGDTAHEQDTKDMVIKCAKDMEDWIKATVVVHDNPAGDQHPPIILGYLGNDPAKPTLLVYGHLDVQPSGDPDLWKYDPFVLTPEGTNYEDIKLYGRGSTDDKGPILAWLNVIEAYQALGMEVPVNIKFCFEAKEESGGDGLEALIEQQASFFQGVDYCCISDNYWLGLTKPCVTYGLRGVTYYNVDITCADADLHSGVYGGTVREAMIDMVNLFSKLTDGKGNILIDGVNDDVTDMTDQELESYKAIDFDPEAYRKQIGTNELLYTGDNSKVDTLTHRWRYPSLSIHGFLGSVNDDVDATVISRFVRGRFSIRLVPNQDPATINQQVIDYCKKVHTASGSKNDIEVTATVSAPAWMSDPNDANYTAGQNAQKKVYGSKLGCDLTREGGSIPVTVTIQDATGASVMLLPLGQSDDGAHSQNEKMSLRNYIEGAKVLGTYLDELGKAGTSGKRKK